MVDVRVEEKSPLENFPVKSTHNTHTHTYTHTHIQTTYYKSHVFVFSVGFNRFLTLPISFLQFCFPVMLSLTRSLCILLRKNYAQGFSSSLSLHLSGTDLWVIDSRCLLRTRQGEGYLFTSDSPILHNSQCFRG